MTFPRRAPDDAAAVGAVGGDEVLTALRSATVDGERRGQREMSLVEHLEELRRRSFVCLAAVSLGTIVAFLFRDALLALLLRPLPIEANALVGHDGTRRIAVTAIGEGFSILMKLSIAAGIALAIPVWVHQLWSFTAPALRPHERKYAVPATVIGIGLFLTGVAVGFVTLRYPINWLLGFDDGRFVHIITADNYFTFVAFFLLAFGITFELPLVLTFLALIGVVSSEWLRARRAYIVVGLWIVSCFVTPGADPYSPLIVGVAFTVLYFISESLIRLIGR